jgi:hypothetical protein
LQPSLEDSGRLLPVFTSLDLATVHFIQSKVPVFMSPSDRVA